MMLTFDTIFGVMLGIEIADQEVKEAFDLAWGFYIDLFIIRITVSKPLDV